MYIRHGDGMAVFLSVFVEHFRFQAKVSATNWLDMKTTQNTNKIQSTTLIPVQLLSRFNWQHFPQQFTDKTFPAAIFVTRHTSRFVPAEHHRNIVETNRAQALIRPFPVNTSTMSCTGAAPRHFHSLQKTARWSLPIQVDQAINEGNPSLQISEQVYSSMSTVMAIYQL